MSCNLNHDCYIWLFFFICCLKMHCEIYLEAQKLPKTHVSHMIYLALRG